MLQPSLVLLGFLLFLGGGGQFICGVSIKKSLRSREDMVIFVRVRPTISRSTQLKAKIFALGEWYSCTGLAVVANSGVSTLGFKPNLGLGRENHSHRQAVIDEFLCMMAGCAFGTDVSHWVFKQKSVWFKVNKIPH